MILKSRGARKAVAVFIPAILVSAMVSPAARAATEISFLVDNGNVSREMWTALSEDFNKSQSDVKVTVEFRPGGADGDNLVKTKLATGEMNDVFLYNSGSLFQAINPVKNLVELGKEPWINTISSSFFPSVTGTDKKIYGAPFGTAMGGGIMYNKAIYEKLGLKIPLTWKEFIANCEKAKKAGYTAVIQTYKDTWTSQLLVLGDHFNVEAESPGYSAKYTANKAKISTNKAAFAGFAHLEEVNKKGFLNKDYKSATFNKGLEYLALGKGVHYPMLSAAIDTIVQNFPENANDVGIFAQPGTNAKKNGLTVWMPAGIYIPKTTKNLDAAKKFVAYIVSPASIAVQNKVTPPSGPYFIKGAKLSGKLTVVATDMLKYLNTDGKSGPALEFVSPVKGPNLEKLTVEVGSGIKTAKQGAAAYDKDVEKQAKQLGLEGW